MTFITVTVKVNLTMNARSIYSSELQISPS